MPLPEWRRKLSQRLEELVRVVRSLDLYRFQIRGSLYHHRIHCGRPECHCAQGRGHPRWCLSFDSPQGRHTRTLSSEELRLLTPGAESYRRYRQMRARAAQVTREVFTLIDRIQKGLLRRSPKRPSRRS